MALILIAEDEATYRVQAQVRLEADGHEVITARDADVAWMLLHDKMPGVVLLDYSLPKADGLKFLAAKHEDKKTAAIPVLFMTLKEEARERDQALTLGATDNLVKPFELGSLSARVRLAAIARQYALELEEKNRQLEILATRDPMTGLFNRRAFGERWEPEKSRVERFPEQPLTVIMLDVDHFKNVNDTYGHDVGDTVLKTLATLLSNTLRPTDIAARLGGEEFILVLPHSPLEGGMIVAERIREQFSHVQVLPDGKTKTLSAGLACSSQIPGQDPELLIKLADTALYDSKRSGRNRVTPWSKTMVLKEEKDARIS